MKLGLFQLIFLTIARDMHHQSLLILYLRTSLQISFSHKEVLKQKRISFPEHLIHVNILKMRTTATI